MLDVRFGQASHVGKTHTINEDSMGAFMPESKQEARAYGFLFAVADGGGTHDGHVASETAVKVLLEQFAKSQAGNMLTGLLPRLLQHANTAVHNRRTELEYRTTRMASTIVACALRFDHAVVSHLGNSRCYLVRGGRARQITDDHTWVSQRRQLGLLSACEAAELPSRRILTRSLGPDLFVTPDTTSVSLESGDVLVLCTKGVHDQMLPRDFIRIVAQPEKHPGEVASELVSRAVEIDGSDNATAQVIRVRSIERVANSTPRRDATAISPPQPPASLPDAGVENRP